MGTKTTDYGLLQRQIAALIHAERDFIANAANITSLIYHDMEQLNWVGIYLLKSDELVLGPFQGKPACVRIRIGHGVCGLSVAQRRTIIVPDVHQFPGHIACDSASNSEIVVPLLRGNAVIGVLDLDSPTLSRFGESDRVGLEQIAATLVDRSD